MLEEIVRKVALELSRIRRVRAVCDQHLQRLESIDEIVSSQEEMDRDWYDASVWVASLVLHGRDMEISCVSPASYPVLEAVWLRDIKLMNAYCLWERERQKSAEDYYFEACDRIRNLLQDKERSPREYFLPLKSHIEHHYLLDGKIDCARSEGAHRLVSHKAQRICEITGNHDKGENWFRAQLYVRMFYENIIPAVTESDENSIRDVLRAFEFSKSSLNRYFVVNAFETIIAIQFLDKTKLKGIMSRPELYDYSLVPVRNWPEAAESERISHGRLKYLGAARELIYEGIMPEEEMKALKEKLADEGFGNVVEMVFLQSHLEPYSKMVL